MTALDAIPARLGPWYANGWMVGLVPVSRWGCALAARPRLPLRWTQGPDGPGEVDPSDFEVECFNHLLAHELSRAAGRELAMISDRCWLVGEPLPVELSQAAVAGASLLPWCPGIGWFWSTENRDKPFV